MIKHSRQSTIKEIIRSRSIPNQDELRLELRRRGIGVTQATLSRDLKELGVARVSTTDGPKYSLDAIGGPQIPLRVIGAEVLSIEENEAVILVHTISGAASVVAEFIDGHNLSDMIGTIAGDNTLLVVPRSTRVTKRLLNQLKSLVRGGSS